MNIFCFGFGQVAKNFIKKLKSENFKINLSTTSRNETNTQKFEDIKHTNFQFDNNNFDTRLIKKLEKSDHILISIPPREGTDLVFKNFFQIIENCRVKWIAYLSATSVYGDHKGKWVNEESTTNPTSKNGIGRIQAEKLWMSLHIKKKLPLQIFRLSGIYSNEKNILMGLKSGKTKIVNKKNHFFSRIHVEDVANILFKSLSNFKAGEIYNVSDDQPASSEEVILYGAKILSMHKPKSIEIENIESDMIKNFYKDSKKINNKKMKIFFDYHLKFPTYVEGLDYIRNNLV